jgi:hypothetical protein
MSALLTASSWLKCPHGGRVKATASGGHARAGDWVLRASDVFAIEQCSFSPGGPHPCVTVLWIEPAGRVRHAGAPVLNATSRGICLAGDGAPQGFVKTMQTQTRAAGL